jgi:NADPH:quinone reductase-like Zn-dependent oxidoreductase
MRLRQGVLPCHDVALRQLAVEDFTKGGRRYDFILDNVGNHSLSDTRRALTPNGTLMSKSGGHSQGRWIGSMGAIVKVAVSSIFVKQQTGPSVKFQNHEDLVALKELIEAGKVTPVIDGTYPLSVTPQAMGRVGAGHARGTVVVAVTPAAA